MSVPEVQKGGTFEECRGIDRKATRKVVHLCNFMIQSVAFIVR